jgi:hypothetical protein
MPIEALTPATLDYVRLLGVTAVARSPSGRIFCTSNPAGCVEAHWCQPDEASRIAASAWRTGDILASARRLRIGVVPHFVMLRHAKQRVPDVPAPPA